jgi:hypothetical protein
MDLVSREIPNLYVGPAPVNVSIAHVKPQIRHGYFQGMARTWLTKPNPLQILSILAHSLEQC